MFTTNRLLLRKMTLAEAPFILSLLNSPGWLQYIGDRNVRSIADAEQYITNAPLKSYTDHGFGLMLVVEKEQGMPVGMCGLLQRDSLDHPDLGFAFLPEYMGRGYALEAASAIIQYADETLQIDTVAAITVPDNAASVKLLSKLGFVLKEKTRLEGDAEELLLFLRKK